MAGRGTFFWGGVLHAGHHLKVHIAESSPLFRGVMGLHKWGLMASSLYCVTAASPPPPPRQALVDLYFFQQANPDQNIDVMLGAASSTFRAFIQKGLLKVQVGGARGGHPDQNIDVILGAASSTFRAFIQKRLFKVQVGGARGERDLYVLGWCGR